MFPRVGARDVLVDYLGHKLFKNLYIDKPKNNVEKMINEGIHFMESSGKSVAKNTDVYHNIVEEYKKQGFSDRHAKNIATFEMMKIYGSDVLKDIPLDAAQKRFGEALERKFSLKK